MYKSTFFEQTAVTALRFIDIRAKTCYTLSVRIRKETAFCRYIDKMSDKTVYTLVATCLFGLEKLVGEEIDNLGGKRTETIDGRVKFTAPLSLLPRFNICMSGM